MHVISSIGLQRQHSSSIITRASFGEYAFLALLQFLLLAAQVLRMHILQASYYFQHALFIATQRVIIKLLKRSIYAQYQTDFSKSLTFPDDNNRAVAL